MSLPSNEVLIAQGKLHNFKKHIDDIERKAESLLIVIREELSPEKNLSEYETENLLIWVRQFREYQLEVRELMDKILRLEGSYNL